MGTFGNTVLESTVVSMIGNVIRGAVFIMGVENNQHADKITVALATSMGTWDGNVKCAFYKHSDLSRIGVTEQRNLHLTTTPTWFDFNFSDPKPNLLASTAYILVVWGATMQSVHAICGHSGDTDQEHYQVLNYNSFPNPLVPTHGNKRYSIYCTYSTTVAIPTLTTEDATGIGRE